jgi:hypothetical protein
VLQDLGNIGQALAALVAIFGIPLAVRQLRMQNRISRLDVLRDLDRRWSQRADRSLAEHPPGAPLLSVATGKAVTELFAALGSTPAFSVDEGDSFPRQLMALSPDLGSVKRAPGEPETPSGGPRNEREYEAVLLARCRMVFPVLDRLTASDDDDHRADIRKVFLLVSGFAASLSDVAEMFDFGLADPEQFMEKRHLAVVRDVHVIEPLLLWQATRTGDHRSMRALRTLALGAAARSYTWLTDFHGSATIGLRRDTRDHLGQVTYGPILRSGTGYSRLPRRLRWRWLRIAVSRPFRDHTKRAQNRLIDRAGRIAVDDALPA